jgi:hypothetical protein
MPKLVSHLRRWTEFRRSDSTVQQAADNEVNSFGHYD